METGKNDIVLVTGGARGIGAAICSHLMATGLKPVVLDVLEPSHSKMVDFFSADLADQEQTRSVLDVVTGKYAITNLVNNVGIVRPARLDDTRLTDFADVFNVNVRGAVQCTQAVLPAMRANNYGRIVNITSRVTLGKELRTAYSASKGALAAMTRTWALELAADGITVNAVAPGPIATEAFDRNNPPESPRTRAIVNSVPVRRLGTPEDVAQAVHFFLGQHSGFITGQTLFVCGGLTVGLAQDA
jgi:NAD(P)-dependent dehydrogenase (short-subunit alcohol dehydrogenase family)